MCCIYSHTCSVKSSIISLASVLIELCTEKQLVTYKQITLQHKLAVEKLSKIQIVDIPLFTTKVTSRVLRKNNKYFKEGTWLLYSVQIHYQ